MPLGITSKTYVNLGTWTVPIWEELRLIGDMTHNQSWNLADASTRDIRVVLQEPTNLTLEISGRVRKSMTNTAFLAMRAAFNNTTSIDVMILDGPMTLTNAEGVRFLGKVTSFTEPQGLQDVVFKEFTIIPCVPPDDTQVPQSVLVLAGAPTFSPISASPPQF